MSGAIPISMTMAAADSFAQTAKAEREHLFDAVSPGSTCGDQNRPLSRKH